MQLTNAEGASVGARGGMRMWLPKTDSTILAVICATLSVAIFPAQKESKCWHKGHRMLEPKGPILCEALRELRESRQSRRQLGVPRDVLLTGHGASQQAQDN